MKIETPSYIRRGKCEQAEPILFSVKCSVCNATDEHMPFWCYLCNNWIKARQNISCATVSTPFRLKCTHFHTLCLSSIKEKEQINPPLKED